MISEKLPLPSQDALKHSQKLLQEILLQIRANAGKISLAKYMELALYAPSLGYYSAGNQKFGSFGDFITAPELSPLFSQCLARQCQQILKELPNGDILEIGAGSGQMAADILITLAETNALPDHYFILELSADLKERQQEKITELCPDFLPRIQWLNELPEHFRGVILGNEVLDAMPVHQFQILDNDIYEVEVIEKDGELNFQKTPSEKPEFFELYHSQEWPDQYTSEINLNIKPWISSLSDILEAGVILLIDYGFGRSEYYHADRFMGTLMCHYRHFAHQDPFLYPGLQDITAHVDFTAVAAAALDAGLEVLGYTHQAGFLLGCGLVELVKQQTCKTEKEKAILSREIDQLTSPAEMGELFKVIALGRNFEGDLIGFSLVDRLYSL